MEFQDKLLNCVDCGTEFVWTAGEQLFFADKNFKKEPKRCKSCKAKRGSGRGGGFVCGGGGHLCFADKNFKNEPKRCKSCKAKRASRPSGGGVVAKERVET